MLNSIGIRIYSFYSIFLIIKWVSDLWTKLYFLYISKWIIMKSSWKKKVSLRENKSFDFASCIYLATSNYTWNFALCASEMTPIYQDNNLMFVTISVKPVSDNFHPLYTWLLYLNIFVNFCKINSYCTDETTFSLNSVLLGQLL